jgi:DNA-directed RNA polymerase sigma subunit (sigma70/sigma32)
MREIRNWQNYEKSRKLEGGFLTLEQELFLFKIRLNGRRDELRSSEELVNNHLSLVHSISKKYKWCNLSYDDLLCFGKLGILQAIERFDVNKNVRFVTYVNHYILGSIRKGVESDNNLIKLPAYITQIAFRLKDIENVESVNEQHRHMFRDPNLYSLSMLKNAVNAKNFKIVEIDVLNEEKHIDGDFLSCIAVDSLIKCLSYKQKLCLQMRFGYDGFLSHTYKQIDVFTGWDSEQVLVGAFIKIRKYTNEQDWYDLLR